MAENVMTPSLILLQVHGEIGLVLRKLKTRRNH
jgi:hypothetical protein